jgi:peptidoglycan/LPS O-acetylase OafA/YrhL
MPVKPRFKNLDSIRTLAFASTFLAHAFSTTSPEVSESLLYGAAVHLREVYGFGVPVFFVLSGFLISYLMLFEQESVGSLGVGGFYVRRALRIWPLYFLVLVVGFVAFPLVRGLVEPSPYVETASPLWYVLFAGNFDQIRTDALPYGVGLGPTWSIGIEEQFYLVWPLLLVAFPGRRFLVPILGVYLASVVLSPLLRLPAKHTIFAMIYLSTGAAYAYLAYYREDLVRRWTDVPDAVPVLLAGAMVAAMYVTTVADTYLPIPLIGLLIGYLLVQQCYTRRFDLSSVPLLERAGKYTYGLYLYHTICNFAVHVAVVDILQVGETPVLAVLVKPALALTLSAVVSVASYRYLERFFLQLKRKRFTALS